MFINDLGNNNKINLLVENIWPQLCALFLTFVIFHAWDVSLIARQITDMFVHKKSVF
jgi:hypothetical protein